MKLEQFELQLIKISSRVQINIVYKFMAKVNVQLWSQDSLSIIQSLYNTYFDESNNYIQSSITRRRIN